MNHVHLHGLCVELKSLLFMKITQGNVHFLTQIMVKVLTTRSFRNVFVDCVVDLAD